MPSSTLRAQFPHNISISFSDRDGRAIRAFAGEFGTSASAVVRSLIAGDITITEVWDVADRIAAALRGDVVPDQPPPGRTNESGEQASDPPIGGAVAGLAHDAFAVSLTG